MDVISTGHDDFVHDVAYDYYGRRIATCSSDRKIKVWMQGADGAWHRQAEWSAHDAAVWRVTFAHPEFGQIIASCSFDRNVFIWEEQEAPDSRGRIVSQWNKRAQLSDARDSVNEIKFAPRHLGLKIAAGSADGHVRVYEATDATSLAHWEFTDEFEAEPSSRGGVACLAWTTSSFDTAMMIVGGGSGMAKIWGYSPAARRWLPMLELNGHGGRIQDVAWAPNVGRSYHLIVTGDALGEVTIWKLLPDSTADYGGEVGQHSRRDGSRSRSGVDATRWHVKKLAGSSAEAAVEMTFNEHGGKPVWRVEWNVTGTVMASSGDDGKLRLNKLQDAGAHGPPEWQTTAVLDMDRTTVEGAPVVQMDHA